MLSILARILFIMAYGVLGLDRLHNCLRLHDTGFVMSCLRLFVRALFVLLCHYCFLALQCYPACGPCAIAFFVTLIVYRIDPTVDGNNHRRQRSIMWIAHSHIPHVIILELITGRRRVLLAFAFWASGLRLS